MSKSTRKNKFATVQVIWLDSVGSTGRWTMLESMEDAPDRVTSVGYLVRDSKKGVLIVPHLDLAEGRHQGQGEIFIPRECVVSIKPLVLADD